MKMSKLFVTVFEDELKQRGFKRKGRLYYRMKGEILQGIVIKKVNPYSLHFGVCPYWTVADQSIVYSENLTKGWWAEQITGWEIGVPIYSYYREQNEEFNLAVMQHCLFLAQKYILPHLDCITDFNSVLKYSADKAFCDERRENAELKQDVRKEIIVPSYQNRRDPSDKFTVIDRFLSRHTQYLFLHKAYLDQSFEAAEEMLTAALPDDYFDVPKPLPLSPDFYPDWVLQDKELVEKIMKVPEWEDSYRELFFEKKNANDLNWIATHVEKRKKDILPRLRDELGLDTTLL